MMTSFFILNKNSREPEKVEKLCKARGSQLHTHFEKMHEVGVFIVGKEGVKWYVAEEELRVLIYALVSVTIAFERLKQNGRFREQSLIHT